MRNKTNSCKKRHCLVSQDNVLCVKKTPCLTSKREIEGDKPIVAPYVYDYVIEEIQGKIEAVKDARRDENFVIIGRSDARGVVGVIER